MESQPAQFQAVPEPITRVVVDLRGDAVYHIDGTDGGARVSVGDEVGVATLHNALAMLHKAGCRWDKALALLDKRDTLLRPLAEALAAADEAVRPCSVCASLDSTDPCAICADARRDPGQQREMQRRLLVHRRNAHQSADRQVQPTAFGHERIGLVRQNTVPGRCAG